MPAPAHTRLFTEVVLSLDSYKETSNILGFHSCIHSTAKQPQKSKTKNNPMKRTTSLKENCTQKCTQKELLHIFCFLPGDNCLLAGDITINLFSLLFTLCCILWKWQLSSSSPVILLKLNLLYKLLVLASWRQLWAHCWIIQKAVQTEAKSCLHSWVLNARMLPERWARTQHVSIRPISLYWQENALTCRLRDYRNAQSLCHPFVSLSCLKINWASVAPGQKLPLSCAFFLARSE